MEKTLHYYNCFITFNGEKTSLPFSRLLEAVYILDEEDKYREIKTGAYSLIKMKLIDDYYSDVNDRVVCFANYRNKKPFLGSRRQDRLEEIDDDILEATTCFFQNTGRLMIFEYNHIGARPRHIEKYLSAFLPKAENAVWGVEFIEIEPDIGLEDIRNTNDIRNIEFKLDLSSHQRRQIMVAGAPESIVANLFFQTIDTQTQLGGNFAKIMFGNGRKGDNHLETQQIIELINILDLESEVYESVRVKYYSHQLRRVHELDLKNAGVLKNKIDIDGDSWEVTGDSIEIEFYDGGRLGGNKYLDYQDELVYVNNLPELVISRIENEENNPEVVNL